MASKKGGQEAMSAKTDAAVKARLDYERRGGGDMKRRFVPDFRPEGVVWRGVCNKSEAHIAHEGRGWSILTGKYFNYECPGVPGPRHRAKKGEKAKPRYRRAGSYERKN